MKKPAESNKWSRQNHWKGHVACALFIQSFPYSHDGKNKKAIHNWSQQETKAGFNLGGVFNLWREKYFMFLYRLRLKLKAFSVPLNMQLPSQWTQQHQTFLSDTWIFRSVLQNKRTRKYKSPWWKIQRNLPETSHHR